MKYPRLVKDSVLTTPIEVSIEAEGVDENGAPLAVSEYSGKCNWQDTARRVITSDRSEVQLTAQAYFDGDICPETASITGGKVTVFGEERRIVQGMKARNPDGSVNYTRLDVR